MSQSAPNLEYQQLKEAVRSKAVAIRMQTELQPVGGPGDKVFPPTYLGQSTTEYPEERRRLATGEVVDCVLLDSVASQANRFEEALLQAYDLDKLSFPLIEIDLSGDFPDIGRITSLDAPHRIADAIFRESSLDGVPFRESDEGREFIGANLRNATPLYRLSPTSLIFGTWDSTGAGGGRGNKFARALTSEIVAIDIQRGVTTASRLDPTGIENVGGVYRAKQGGLTSDPDKAEKDEKGNPSEIRPSEVNLGNIPPTVEEIGGVTMSHALQTTVLSLAGLRRLRFPDEDGSPETQRDDAARTVLSALALAAFSYSREAGYDLRSRCMLVPNGPSPYELIDTGHHGLVWDKAPIRLIPTEGLVELIRRSRDVRHTDEG